MSRVPLYDALAVDYDRFVNWQGRLSHELPFFLGLFENHGIRRVLDVACGTGHHMIALAKHGYQGLGVDLSAAMIERARENTVATGVEATFAVQGFDGLSGLNSRFDAVLCLGNSLPHLLSAKAVQEALCEFAAVLRPKGLLVLQNRNFDQVWAKQIRFMSPQTYREQDGEWIFVRFYDFHEETVTFNMVRLQKTEDGWIQNVESTELRPIFQADLADGLEKAGFDSVALYGGYDSTAFDPDESGDLIIVAQRR